MVRRLAIYLAAFAGAFIVWIGLAVVEAINPFLPWQYPALALFMGMGFPGGASPEMHYMNHVAETWFPFLVAFFIAKILTKKRARFYGALMLYGAFLLWSLAMVWLDQKGMPLNTIFLVGLMGTFFGGGTLYFLLVDPQQSKREFPAIQK
ncbi:hypothetical protein [Maliponia aquimaris]|uniref:hypothetical protein n=1 Tax=Maliponia aquimaris TaxID=1673631 RepID=UPI00113FE5C2|nr:hypothetical protein [Maliponia aquimaris]